MSFLKKNTSSRLRQRLTLQQEIQLTDGAGGYTRSWKEIADLWAEVIPLSGREKLVAGKLESKLSHKIVTRYRSDVSPAHRLVFENRAFNIRYVLDVTEDKTLLELLVEEGGA